MPVLLVTIALLVGLRWLSSRQARIAELDQRVRERTSVLELARDAALDAARAKAQFLANMSHEIRTPMNGVLGVTELLLRSDLNPRQRHSADVIHGSGEGLLVVINDILDDSRFEAGALLLESLDFNLRMLIEDTSALLGERAHAKGIELACAWSAEVPEWINGDPHRLRQVLGNLLGNAVKFTQAGEVALTVSLQPVAAGVALQFSVRDTGIGMSEAELADLFQPFAQPDSSTRRGSGGSGLGLVIAQQIVRAMGRELELQSAKDVGTCATFTLLLRVARTTTDTGNAAPDALRGCTAWSRSRRTWMGSNLPGVFAATFASLTCVLCC